MAGTRTFDVIVIGVGGMGSAAVDHLVQRGRRVLGLEQFAIGHDRGSSHGVNRIYRLAYYEDPGYVPLMRRALALWLELERAAGEQLVVRTGSVDAGPPESEVFAGSLRSCELHGLDHEVLTSAELAARFPGYRLPSESMALYQPDGGFVMSERAIFAHVARAEAASAEIHSGERVLDWAPAPGGGVVVATDRGRYEAESLIVTAGAWAARMLPQLVQLAVPERQVLGWFATLRPEHFTPGTFPVFNLHVDEGRYYGFPEYGVPGFKIGLYHHRGEVADPDALDRSVHTEDEAVLRAAVARYFPDADGPLLSTAACMFTNTPDEHFIIDSLAEHPNIHVAAGFSGHGYKFASAVGEVLADLAISGDSAFDLSMFRIDRFVRGEPTVDNS